jgi:probable selenate reductase FAD-binding subunit
MFDQVEAFYRPTSVAQALRLLQRAKGQARIVAGGTDVVVAGGDGVRALIDLTRAGLSYIRHKSSDLAIGATTTLAEIEESAVLRRTAGGILSRAAATCGSVPIRNLATLGGNMANASAAADMAAPLLVLDASVVVVNARGRRRLPLADYLGCAAAGHLSKAILVEVLVPAPPRERRSGWSFHKLGRTAVDISLVNVAAGVGLEAKGRVQWARLALGSVAPTALRALAAEQCMAGRIPDRALIAEAAAEVARAVSPISDVRASAEYRREMSAVLSTRALEECVTKAGGSL